LDHEHIILPDAVADPHEGVVVAELEYLGAPDRNAEIVADLLDQSGVRVPAEDLNLLPRSCHRWSFPPGSGHLCGKPSRLVMRGRLGHRPTARPWRPGPRRQEPPAPRGPPPAAPRACYDRDRRRIGARQPALRR